MAESEFRVYHSTKTVRNDLYLWGGAQYGLPLVHDVGEKQNFTTKVDVFSLSALEWINISTTGVPPAGVMGYSSTVVGKEMFYFGGRCNRGSCCHNELYVLNVESMAWRKISSNNKPIEKFRCGLISYSYQDSDYLLLLGGRGNKPPKKQQKGSLYYPCHGAYITNEVHIMDITKSPSEWRVPVIKGQSPPPLAYFTLDALPIGPESQAILFGGEFVTDRDKHHCSNDLYLMTLTNDTVEYSKLSPLHSDSQWPLSRDRHSSTIITSMTDEEETHLMVIGGHDNGKTLADCWLFNIATRRWNKLDLPQLVCGRWNHSVSSISMCTNTQWIIVTGGYGKDKSLFRGASVTVIVEIEYFCGQWMLRGVWNSTQTNELSKRKKELCARFDRERNEERIAHLEREIVILTEQLRQSQQETRHVRGEYQIASQKENKMHQNTQMRYQHATDLALRSNSKQVYFPQVQTLQSDLTKDDGKSSRGIGETVDEHQDIRQNLDSPPWVIQSDEVTMTDDIVGEGGWGVVKVGIFRGTKVAVKCLHAEIVSNFHLELFSMERDIASSIRHPNLLQFIGATIVDEPMIVTELMPTTLRKEIQKSRMAKQQIVVIAIDILSALNYLHLWKPHPILHGDVSSANVLLDVSERSQWKAKLSDYGSVILLGNRPCNTVGPGNPVYSAPEATNPELHSPSKDIYSFGILLVEMATGCFPAAVQVERDVQVREVKWPEIKRLIISCTDNEKDCRPNAENILEDFRVLYLNDFNK